MAATSGCSQGALTRFAPPGIIKYEDIASEKPANPAISAVIKERKDAGDADFPLIAETPGASARPAKPEQAAIDAQVSELTRARDGLNAAVEHDRIEAENESQSASALEDSRLGLEENILRDSEASAAERKKPLSKE